MSILESTSTWYRISKRFLFPKTTCTLFFTKTYTFQGIFSSPVIALIYLIVYLYEPVFQSVNSCIILIYCILSFYHVELSLLHSKLYYVLQFSLVLLWLLSFSHRWLTKTRLSSVVVDCERQAFMSSLVSWELG